MSTFFGVLRTNPNYRYTWIGQVVSEIGDHFNNIAVFSLALAHTESGLVVTGIMLSRAIPAILAGPIAGVILDRYDRRRIMMTSDLLRAVLALGFIFSLHAKGNSTLYIFSALLMFASPFFSSGRSAILPTITTKEELHIANSLTQTTQAATLTLGTLFAGVAVDQLGFEWAFVFNSLSFVISAICISRLRVKEGNFRPQRAALTEADVARPWHEYREGLYYMRSSPLILGIALLAVGWATGGGAAQILFSLFGEIVFHRGAAGIGIIWSFAGVGLLVGGATAYRLGKRISFQAYRWVIVACYVIHGGAYVVFSQMQSFAWALFFIALSRAASAMSSVLNNNQLLRHVDDAYRGRVFSTIESMVWATMMLSMMGAGIASQHYSPRTIGVWAGILSSLTAVFWGWATVTDRLKEPENEVDTDIEIHGEPTI
ncbi:MAG TPA: MFS transporter [Bryobacteraceae bacterium]|jgi:MFS family permease